jgi:hypothetical protein
MPEKSNSSRRRVYQISLSGDEHAALIEIANLRAMKFSALVRSHLVTSLIQPYLRALAHGKSGL